MSKSELAAAMGYKGISAKLRKVIEALIEQGALKEEIVDGKIKLKAAD